MKRLLLICLICFVAVALVGCSSGNKVSNEDKIKDTFVGNLVDWYSFNESQAIEAYDLLESLGCGDIELIQGSSSGSDLDVIRATVNKHQVNITADKKKVFYVQITGFKEDGYAWVPNWRGKLKYKIIEKKISFDLYDSDSEGYIAFYNAEDNTVIPWSEHEQ